MQSRPRHQHPHQAGRLPQRRNLQGQVIITRGPQLSSGVTLGLARSISLDNRLITRTHPYNTVQSVSTFLRVPFAHPGSPRSVSCLRGFAFAGRHRAGLLQHVALSSWLLYLVTRISGSPCLLAAREPTSFSFEGSPVALTPFLRRPWQSAASPHLPARGLGETRRAPAQGPSPEQRRSARVSSQGFTVCLKREPWMGPKDEPFAAGGGRTCVVPACPRQGPTP